MKIYDLIDRNLLEDMLEKKYINVQVHPEFGYKLYNYSKSCTLEHVWNDATELCRGLITDADDNIIARPFRKFYNYEEIVDKSIIPDNLPFKIYDKKDGSLGILYWSPDGVPLIATRGSFKSDQAEWATAYLRNILYKREDELWENLIDWNTMKVRYTLLFEIVYPDDRHVVDYGKEESLTLLAIIDNETGKEREPDTLRNFFDVIKTYNVKDWKTIRDMYDGDNAEGFVVKFKNNFRMKLKYEQWFRKNALIAGLSRRKVLEFVVNDDLKGLFGIVNQLNEENRIYYTDILINLRKMYAEMERDAFLEYREFNTDKEAAEYFNKCKNRPILFAIRKGKDYSSIIWKKIKELVKDVPKCEEE